MRWTVERVIADPDGFGDWLAVTPDDDPESIRIGKELAEAWQAELDSMSPAERKAWLAFLDGDGDDDPGGRARGQGWPGTSMRAGAGSMAEIAAKVGASSRPTHRSGRWGLGPHRWPRSRQRLHPV